MADSGIITMEEYGNVRLKLKERMDSDGINRNTLARRIGVRFEVVDKWYRGDVGHLSRVNAQKSKNIFYEARMRAISSRKSCSEHR